ncbi:hypothetical protein BB559_002244 [Furculomyces boomerangus]|uniref:Kinase n=2 Tax=Harpellales TaxID=61421 RepID=A0A2T9YWU8_9FUNG|nr:hypothetical protein BB559_005020 [Furculomyces boomerangus]PVU96798.1 hypothetical protein BB559_002244 [Furculomyces boomerangus]PVZ98142.1 hypothetical protein BB558_005877 [Smittium angustum]
MDSNSKKFSQINNSSSFIPLENKVAGHDCVLAVEDESLIIKLVSQKEIQFYEDCTQHTDFQQFIPTFYGILKENPAIKEISESLDLSTIQNGIQSQDSVKTYICLENVTRGYSMPNIIDIKIGTQLHSDDAAPAKRQKMEEKAKSTTSGTLGMKICGSQVYSNGVPKKFSQEYCRKLDKDGMIKTLNEFFPIEILGNDYRIQLIDQIVDELKDYLNIVRTKEFRLYSSSLLLVYESNPNDIESFINSELNETKTDTTRPTNTTINNIEHQTTKNADFSDSDSESEPENKSLFDLRAIDFTHSTWTPGLGPDEKYIFGIKNLIKILKSL